MKRRPVAWDVFWDLQPCLMFENGEVMAPEDSQKLYPEYFKDGKPIWNKLPLANDLDEMGDFDE